MRVVVNQLVALSPKTGVGHYTTQLLRCLREQAGTDQIDAFPEGLFKRLRGLGGRMRCSVEAGSDGSSPGLLARLRSKALHHLRRWDHALTASCFRAVCARRRYDLYHEPNLIPLPCDRPTVVTLPDLSVLLHPQWHPADRVAHFEKHFYRGLRDCVHFLAISESCRQEVIRTLSLPPERVTRTYMGVRPGLGALPADEVAAVLRRLGLPPRYLLCLGTIEPRKNVLRLLRTYVSLPERLRSRWPLLLVGRWGWSSGDVAAYYHHEARHRGVHHVGYVADEDLPALYNGARALVFPSYYEGFGLPPIEMMACGGAVLASTADAVVETVGSRAHLVAPEDDDGWRQALVRVLEDEDWLRSLRRGAAELARAYTWDRCAADTLRVYRSLCGEGEAPARRAA